MYATEFFAVDAENFKNLLPFSGTDTIFLY